MHIVKLENICKSYDNLQILDDINIKFKKRTSTALVGPTGSGKTVLLRIIDLLERPSSGTVYFEGVDANSSSSTRLEIRRKIGMVFQKPLAFKANVYDNVAYGLKIRGEKKDLEKKVKETLETVELKGYENRNALKLSGGETQRLALARAMITDPKLLLLDEPTSNLDPLSTKKIEELITTINSEHETTVIMTTHNIFQGRKLADEMIITNKGQIFQSGTPDKIFKMPESRFVADFIGIENVMEGTVTRTNGDLARIKTSSITVYAVTKKQGHVNFSIRHMESM
ncbi:MAG TPA: phosphate ABC transporter ATP-binding protein [Methanobacterium sp.]|nr:phosphate ABC transporter ATP-binding protein [Methanobacterium sp.]